MNTPNRVTAPEYTPEEMAALYAKHKALFTVEDLLGYVEDDEPTRPAEEVLENAKRLIADAVAKRRVSA